MVYPKHWSNHAASQLQIFNDLTLLASSFINFPFAFPQRPSCYLLTSTLLQPFWAACHFPKAPRSLLHLHELFHVPWQPYVFPSPTELTPPSSSRPTQHQHYLPLWCSLTPPGWISFLMPLHPSAPWAFLLPLFLLPIHFSDSFARLWTPSGQGLSLSSLYLQCLKQCLLTIDTRQIFTEEMNESFA